MDHKGKNYSLSSIQLSLGYQGITIFSESLFPRIINLHSVYFHLTIFIDQGGKNYNYWIVINDTSRALV